MKKYLSLIEEILKEGIKKKDRTGTGTISKFGAQRRYDLSKGFPLLTTKSVHWKSVLHELIWFINGDTNIKYLVDNGVRIWNEWPYEIFKKSIDYKNETLVEFVEKIKNDKKFAKKYGELGPVYGAQWRNFNNQGIDQLNDVQNALRNNPESRRIIISAWNPSQIKDMALPPCHAFIQFYVNDGKLSCQLYQRSADIFLGVPFNIASYSLLTMMLAQTCKLKVGEFIHTLGDAHIYSNHINQVNEQLLRKPKTLPMIKLNPEITSIFDFKAEDVELINYDPHPIIRGKVAI